MADTALIIRLDSVNKGTRCVEYPLKAACISSEKPRNKPDCKALALNNMASNDLIASTHSVVDNSIDGFPLQGHIAVAELWCTSVGQTL